MNEAKPHVESDAGTDSPARTLGLFSRPEWSFGARVIPSVVVQSLGRPLPSWVLPVDEVDGDAECELVLVREPLSLANVAIAVGARWAGTAPPYRIALFPQQGPSLTDAAQFQAFPMTLGVEPGRMDTVSEALAILSTGHVLIGADLGMLWDAVGQRAGISGRAMVLDGIGDDARAAVVQHWLEEVSASGYGGGLLLMQLVKAEEHHRLTLSSLDAFASASMDRCGDRSRVLTGSLDATETAVVVIAFRPAKAVGREWSDEVTDATRAAIDKAAVLGDELCLKHAEGAFGVVAANDAIRGELRVTDRHTGRTQVFEDAGALLGAGWVID